MNIVADTSFLKEQRLRSSPLWHTRPTVLHTHIRKISFLSIPKFSRSNESSDAVLVEMMAQFCI